MKALIFNSGTGSRMGKLTEKCPKCLVKLPNGETILLRQLRILSECGITDAVITTGKYTSEIIAESEKCRSMSLTFVENPRYAETNYIYSMYLAAKYLNDDILMLHGDLVFEKEVIRFMLSRKETDLCMYEKSSPLPDKDFKCMVENDILRRVSVDIFGRNCYAFQPIYKLSRETFRLWADRVGVYITAGKMSVYAEDALNDILPQLAISAVENHNGYIREIDNEDDFLKVGSRIALLDFDYFENISILPEFIESLCCERPFVTVGRHCRGMIEEMMVKNGHLKCCFFSDYRENPDEESIKRAANAFRMHKSDIIISIGGGSIIDTAKAVKVLTGTNAPHMAVPTTAGSGSEATKFAVYYKNGEKRSFDKTELLPEYSVLDSSLLYTLNKTQRMTTLLDALCHSAESLLSVHADSESRRYAKNSIRLINEYYQRYAQGEHAVYGMIMIASHYAGKAINISKTAAGHAMSYVLTSRLGIKHGQAAAVCLKNIFAVLSEENRLPADHYGIYRLLSDIYAAAEFKACRCMISAEELSHNINTERMKNFSLPLGKNEILEIYKRITSDLQGSS